MLTTMTEANFDQNPAASASRFPQSCSRRPVVRHSRALEGAIYALLQAARIFTDAAESRQPRLNDAELEVMVGQMIQNLIFKLNRTRMFYFEQNFRQSLVFPRAGCEDTDDAWKDEVSEAEASKDAPGFWQSRQDSAECEF